MALHVGDSGVGINIGCVQTVNGIVTPFSVLDATSLQVLVIDPRGNSQTYSYVNKMTTTYVSPNGITFTSNFWAQMVNTGNEFPIPGTYKIYLIATFPSGVLKSDPMPLKIEL